MWSCPNGRPWLWFFSSSLKHQQSIDVPWAGHPRAEKTTIIQDVRILQISYLSNVVTSPQYALHPTDITLNVCTGAEAEGNTSKSESSLQIPISYMGKLRQTIRWLPQNYEGSQPLPRLTKPQLNHDAACSALLSILIQQPLEQKVPLFPQWKP